MNQETFADYGIELDIEKASRNSFGPTYWACPNCAPAHPKSAKKKVLAVWYGDGNWFCNRCRWAGYLKHKSKKDFMRPKADIKNKGTDDENIALMDWFWKRNIPSISYKSFGVRAYVQGSKVYVAFPYYLMGQLMGVKYRNIADKKDMFWETDSSQTLFGIDGYDPEMPIVITEGELDAIALRAAGVPNAFSVPNGANKNFNWYQTVSELLDPNADVILALDDDESGRAFTKECIRVFGDHRCKTVVWPAECKDANDVLVKHGSQVLKAVIDQAKAVPMYGVIDVDAMNAELLDVYRNGYPSGMKTGIAELDRHCTFHAPALVTITGISTSGKSTILDQLLVRLALVNGVGTMLFSPENYPSSTHKQRLVEQLVGKNLMPGRVNRMTIDELAEASEWIDRRFWWVYPEDTNFDLQDIFKLALYHIKKYGIKFVVIDAWNKLKHPNDEREDLYISRVLDDLLHFARKHGLIFFVVAHPKSINPDKNGNIRPATIFDISGGKDFASKSDVGLSVSRVRDLETGKHSFEGTVHFQKVKHKHYGQEGSVTLQFDPNSQRLYSESATAAFRGNWLRERIIETPPPQAFNLNAVPELDPNDYNVPF